MTKTKEHVLTNVYLLNADNYHQYTKKIKQTVSLIALRAISKTRTNPRTWWTLYTINPESISFPNMSISVHWGPNIYPDRLVNL